MILQTGFPISLMFLVSLVLPNGDTPDGFSYQSNVPDKPGDAKW